MKWMLKFQNTQHVWIGTSVTVIAIGLTQIRPVSGSGMG